MEGAKDPSGRRGATEGQERQRVARGGGKPQGSAVHPPNPRRLTWSPHAGVNHAALPGAGGEQPCHIPALSGDQRSLPEVTGRKPQRPPPSEGKIPQRAADPELSGAGEGRRGQAGSSCAPLQRAPAMRPGQENTRAPGNQINVAATGGSKLGVGAPRAGFGTSYCMSSLSRGHRLFTCFGKCTDWGPRSADPRALKPSVRIRVVRAALGTWRGPSREPVRR